VEELSANEPNVHRGSINLAFALPLLAVLAGASLFAVSLWQYPEFVDRQATDLLDRAALASPTPLSSHERILLERDLLQLKNTARTTTWSTIAQLIGGVVIATGLYLTWRTVRATERNVALTQDNIRKSFTVAMKTLENNQEGKYTDRFTNAVGQLGNEHMGVRLGGLYALLRLAHDSITERSNVIRMFCTYIRSHSSVTVSEGGNIDGSIDKAELDIQECFNLIDRNIWDKYGQTYLLDVSESNLKGISAGDFNLSSINLSRANLQEASFIGAGLHSAILLGCNLSKARMHGADLRHANLASADLREADFSKCQLQGAILDGADLEGANLSEANLSGASLYQARLHRARLSSADLQEADLRGADLRDAILNDANLSRAILSEAVLDHASLYMASLADSTLFMASLRGADLTQADLSRAILSHADFQDARFDETILDGATTYRTHGLPRQP
jgi:uncharacterized protein YjbI with pentapeptide repeats